MNTNNDLLETFFVATASGSVYKINYQKRKVTVKKIFSEDPENSNNKVGYELFPKAKFVGITKNMGLWKCQPDNGKRIHIQEESKQTWIGMLEQTSPIVGLFLEKDPSIAHCKRVYNTPAPGIFAKATACEPHYWYELNETIAVLKKNRQESSSIHCFRCFGNKRK